MSNAVKQFANNASAKRYFKSMKLDYLHANKISGNLGFANIYLEDNTIIAKSTYYTDYTLEKMLNSKGKEY